MKLKHKLPLLLAAALQVFPLARTVYTLPSTTPTLGIIMRWAIGSAATLGAYDACSGASAIVFTSPTNATATVGQPFSFTITCTNFGTDPGAKINVAVVPLYTNLLTFGLTNYTVEVTQPGDPSTVINMYGIISGTPTVATNNMKITLKATHPVYAGNYQTNLYLTILVGGSAPSITNQPIQLTTITAGGAATFNVGATGAAPLTYRWRLNGTPLANATNSSLSLTNVRASQAGNYSVGITNGSGGVVSSNAQLVVNAPAAPTLTVLSAAPYQFRFSFVPIVGLTNTVQTNGALTGSWNVFTNIAPPASATSVIIIDAISGDARNYRVRVDP